MPRSRASSSFTTPRLTSARVCSGSTSSENLPARSSARPAGVSSTAAGPSSDGSPPSLPADGSSTTSRPSSSRARCPAPAFSSSRVARSRASVLPSLSFTSARVEPSVSRRAPAGTGCPSARGVQAPARSQDESPIGLPNARCSDATCPCQASPSVGASGAFDRSESQATPASAAAAANQRQPSRRPCAERCTSGTSAIFNGAACHGFRSRCGAGSAAGAAPLSDEPAAAALPSGRLASSRASSPSGGR
ncbi:MAG TPA: hypothetical protein VFS67_03735 [Polyangiaceae bacterium]|nr:hypothetical protein [Polyangiaceae bacterium]